jgi:hypothetical protein
MRRPEGLSPIDGTHRLAVLSALRIMPEEKFASLGLEKPAEEVWVGTTQMASYRWFSKMIIGLPSNAPAHLSAKDARPAR